MVEQALKPNVSVVIPAKNEAISLARLIPELQATLPGAEIVIVNDGSTDNTSAICAAHGVHEVRHPQSRGNGAAVKSGLRAASHETVVLMDGDGQHRPEDIHPLLNKLTDGYDLVVAARSKHGQASVARRAANGLYNRFASLVSGMQIDDLTSGFRAGSRRKLCEFIYLYPNGFSYPTTSTMAFLRAGYSVAYLPTSVFKREGKSHISPLKDGARFLAIILKIATLYSPLKVFLPTSGVMFLAGAGYLLYTLTQAGRFTNMSVLLLVMALVVFLIGLVAEQITVLQYKDSGDTATNRAPLPTPSATIKSQPLAQAKESQAEIVE